MRCWYIKKRRSLTGLRRCSPRSSGMRTWAIGAGPTPEKYGRRDRRPVTRMPPSRPKYVGRSGWRVPKAKATTHGTHKTSHRRVLPNSQEILTLRNILARQVSTTKIWFCKEAFKTACAVVSASRASRASRRCFSTVAIETPRIIAISWTILPSPTHSSTSR